MATDEASCTHDVQQALRVYLRERPDAADTLIGISQWWLPDWLKGIAMEHLRSALLGLVATHEVRCTVLPDGTELFGRGPEVYTQPGDDAGAIPN